MGLMRVIYSDTDGTEWSRDRVLSRDLTALSVFGYEQSLGVSPLRKVVIYGRSYVGKIPDRVNQPFPMYGNLFVFLETPAGAYTGRASISIHGFTEIVKRIRVRRIGGMTRSEYLALVTVGGESAALEMNRAFDRAFPRAMIPDFGDIMLMTTTVGRLQQVVKDISRELRGE